jgi:protein transport protein SEC9
VEAIKQEIRFTKQESLSSTRNAIRIASEVEEQGCNTLIRLGGQSEKLSGIEKNLDISASQARIAEDKACELKKLNRSIFAVHVSNPFGGKAHAEEEERKIIERHEMEHDEWERACKYVYDSSQCMNSALDKSDSGRKSIMKGGPYSIIIQRSQFSFEEDEEDIQMEKDIDINLSIL